MSNVSPPIASRGVAGVSPASYRFSCPIAPHVQEYIDSLPPLAERTSAAPQSAGAPESRS